MTPIADAIGQAPTVNPRSFLALGKQGAQMQAQVTHSQGRVAGASSLVIKDAAGLLPGDASVAELLAARRAALTG